MQSGGFRSLDGRFDREGFSRVHQTYEYGTERNFMVERADGDIGRQDGTGPAGERPALSEGEGRDALRRRLEEVRIAFVALDSSRPAEGIESSDEQVAEFLAEREEEARNLYHERSESTTSPSRCARATSC